MTVIEKNFDTDKSLSALDRHALKRHGWRLAGLQMAILLLATALFEAFDLDRTVAAFFYRPEQGWYLAKAPVWAWLYKYGTIPGLAVTLSALGVYAAGFFRQRLRPWQRPCLIVVLTAVIAAGLLVNAVLKQYWGRPRPDQTIEFGGKWAYRPVFTPGTPGKGASFPCGHCTMGFVLLAMAGFHRRSKMLAVAGVAAGVVLGVLLSAARVVQGAHFVSDTIWSLGIVAMTVTILYTHLSPLSLNDQSAGERPATGLRKVWTATVAVIAVLIMALGFLTRRPYYNTMVFPLVPASVPKAVHIRINAEPERIAVQYGNHPIGRLQVDAHGFGWLQFDYHMDFDTRLNGQSLEVYLKVDARSYFAELDHALSLSLPKNSGNKIEVRVNDRLIEGPRP